MSKQIRADFDIYGIAKRFRAGALHTLLDEDQLNATLSLDGSGNVQTAAFTGDVTKTAGSVATTVNAIQGNAVTSGAPNIGAAYVWNGSSFVRTPVTTSILADVNKTVASTTAETSILNTTGTIPAGSLRVGDAIILRSHMVITNNSGSTGSFRFRWKWGSLALVDYTTGSITTGATQIFVWLVDAALVVSQIGVSGQGYIQWFMPLSAAFSSGLSLTNSTIAGNAAVSIGDTTSSIVLDLSTTHTVNNANFNTNMRDTLITKAATT